MADCEYRAGEFEIIVCDNAGDDQTRTVCESFSSQMSIRYLVEKTPGKNHALNAGLEVATGELLLFTDDDVLVDQGWMSSMWNAAISYPRNDIFGGRILPVWPNKFPLYLRENRYSAICFGVLNGRGATKPAPDFIPFGANLGLRRSVFDTGLRYDPEVGPRRGSYMMGSETDLISRLTRSGQVPVYVNDSSVQHRIRPEQASLRWLLGRGTRYGRRLWYKSTSAARTSGYPESFPLWLAKEMVKDLTTAVVRLLVGNRKGSFEAVFEVSIAWGKVRQLFRDRLSEDRRRVEAIRGSGPGQA